MATGDQADIANRIRAVLPSQWFPTSPAGGPSATPVLDGLLAGLGSAWAAMYSLLQYAVLQTRIATATDFFVDLIGQDFFGTALLRLMGETDAAYSARIRKNLFRPKATRAAMVRLLTDLTGNAPTIIEPANPGDCGGWDTGNIAWDTAGVWGDLLPFQAFITVNRTPGPGGIPGVMGWYDASKPSGQQVGGWDRGAIEWTAPYQVLAQLSDADIYAAIADCMPAASIAWVKITPVVSFQLDISTLGGAATLA